METFFFTFGAGQYGDLLSAAYVIIRAPNQHAARMVMNEHFGRVWCGCYPIEELADQVAQYGLWQLGSLDEHGNVTVTRKFWGLKHKGPDGWGDEPCPNDLPLGQARLEMNRRAKEEYDHGNPLAGAAFMEASSICVLIEGQAEPV